MESKSMAVAHQQKYWTGRDLERLYRWFRQLKGKFEKSPQTYRGDAMKAWFLQAILLLDVFGSSSCAIY
jgi:hypothetical protein